MYKLLSLLFALISTFDQVQAVKDVELKDGMTIILQPSVKPRLNGRFSVFPPKGSQLDPTLFNIQDMVHTCLPEDPNEPGEKCDLLLINAMFMPLSGVNTSFLVRYTPLDGRKPIQAVLNYSDVAIIFVSLGKENVAENPKCISTGGHHFYHVYSLTLFTPSSTIDLSKPLDHITRFVLGPTAICLVPETGSKEEPSKTSWEMATPLLAGILLALVLVVVVGVVVMVVAFKLINWLRLELKEEIKKEKDMLKGVLKVLALGGVGLVLGLIVATAVGVVMETESELFFNVMIVHVMMSLMFGVTIKIILRFAKVGVTWVGITGVVVGYVGVLAKIRVVAGMGVLIGLGVYEGTGTMAMSHMVALGVAVVVGLAVKPLVPNPVGEAVGVIQVAMVAMVAIKAVRALQEAIWRRRAGITEAEHSPQELEVDSGDEPLDVESHFPILYTTLCESVASKWEDFGRHLNVSQSSMERIARERMYYCFREMIKKWLNQQDLPPTKSKIRQVLKEDFGLHGKADQLFSMGDYRRLENEMECFGLHKMVMSTKSPYGNVSHVPFVGEIKVYECDEEGGQLLLDDIEVIIPHGAIPHGMTLLIEMGVALYGPFTFPNTSHPVSPILWFCTQEGFDFRQQLIFRLPHCISEGLKPGVKLKFMKADHWKDYNQKGHTFSFNDVGTDSNTKCLNSCGFLTSSHGCFICIADENETVSQVRKNFCLHILSKRVDSPTSTYEIIVACTFFLHTCVEALNLLFPDDEYEHEISKKFEFDESRSLQVVPSCKESDLQFIFAGSKSSIFASEVDFWNHRSDREQLFKDMELEHKLKLYPPHIKITVHCPASQWATISLKANEDIFPLFKQFGAATPLSGVLPSGAEDRLTDKHFRTLYSTLYRSVAPQWKHFGSCLGVKPYSIEAIDSDRNTNGIYDCFRKLIMEWLNHIDPPPTKAGLIDALKSAGFDAQAEELEGKHFQSRPLKKETEQLASVVDKRNSTLRQRHVPDSINRVPESSSRAPESSIEVRRAPEASPRVHSAPNSDYRQSSAYRVSLKRTAVVLVILLLVAALLAWSFPSVRSLNVVLRILKLLNKVVSRF